MVHLDPQVHAADAFVTELNGVAFFTTNGDRKFDVVVDLSPIGTVEYSKCDRRHSSVCLGDEPSLDPVGGPLTMLLEGERMPFRPSHLHTTTMSRFFPTLLVAYRVKDRKAARNLSANLDKLAKLTLWICRLPNFCSKVDASCVVWDWTVVVTLQKIFDAVSSRLTGTRSSTG